MSESGFLILLLSFLNRGVISIQPQVDIASFIASAAILDEVGVSLILAQERAWCAWCAHLFGATHLVDVAIRVDDIRVATRTARILEYYVNSGYVLHANIHDSFQNSGQAGIVRIIAKRIRCK